jgi:hypothetical protein
MGKDENLELQYLLFGEAQAITRKVKNNSG